VAITATLSVDQSMVPAGIPTHLTLVISNTGTSAVNVLDIEPFVDSAADPLSQQNATNLSTQDWRASLAAGQTGAVFPQTGGTFTPLTRQVPASGSLTLSAAATYYATPLGREPRGQQMPMAYNQAVLVRTDDGSVVTSNTLVICCSQVTNFNVGTNPGQFPQMPTVGQARYESNVTGSPLVPVLFPAG